MRNVKKDINFGIVWSWVKKEKEKRKW